MQGPSQRLIQKFGKEYTIRNATGGGDRDLPTYSDDGTLTGVLERRGRPRTVTDSAGTELEADLEIRAIVESSTTIESAAATDSYPTKLVHPNGTTYRVIQDHEEDGGVTVLPVVVH